MAKYFILIIAAFIVVAILFGAIEVRIEKGEKKTRKQLEKKCTARADGSIKEVKNTPDGKLVKVEYKVNDVYYTVEERIGQYKIKNPEAKKRRDKVTFKDYIICRTGYATPVMYNPRKPQMAYLPDNAPSEEEEGQQA